MNPQGFWNVSFGNLLTIASLLLTFWLAHQSNVRRIKDAAKLAAEEYTEMKSKLDLIYDWFCHNVVGRGESTRHYGMPRTKENDKD